MVPLISKVLPKLGISTDKASHQGARPSSPTSRRPVSPVLNHAHGTPGPTIPNIGSLGITDTSTGVCLGETQNGTARHAHQKVERREEGWSSRDKGKGRALDRVEEQETVFESGMKGIGGRRGPEGYVGELYFRQYRSEVEDLGELMRLVEEELSEPYNIYTFRYFVIEWPHLAFLVFPSTESRIPIGTIVCKQDDHRGRTNRGYIAMLSVDRGWRRRGIASRLIRMAIDEMTRRGAHEIVLETECDNSTSIALYESLGFMREKRLARFYSNGKDAFRLILALPNHPYLQESPDEADDARWAVGEGPEWLEHLGEEEAWERGLGGPVVGDWGDPRGGPGRIGTPRPSGKPELPPRPREWDGMYT